MRLQFLLICSKLIRLGEYKTTQNLVRTGSGEIHHYAIPEEVAPMMAELIEWHREQDRKAELHPVVHAALFHHRFLAIHPFDDGNGRLGRILMNLLVMRAGLPPAIVKLSERNPYIAALRRADAGELEAITTFIAQCVLDSESLYLRGARGGSVEDADDVDKAVALLKQELRAAPILVEFTPEIQAEHFRAHLIPLLQRLDAKLKQFDELFAEVGAGLGNGTARPRHELVSTISDWIAHKTSLRSVTVAYNWNGFLRDGPNDFSHHLSFQITYDRRKFLFNCGNPSMTKQFVYGTWFSEDEVAKFIGEIAKSVLTAIERNLTRRNAS